MRFIADGPSIPDELLLARDEGRVVFFCGAGVSRARANLPDFFGLAKSVSQILGVSSDTPAARIIAEANEIAKRLGESGLIAADRVFGLLERDFFVKDIHAAVAKSLRPSDGVDLSAHHVMLDLARGPEGTLRLVTTNFDRLFESCGNDVHTWRPPQLPDPSRPDDLNGIIYLHGRVNSDYSGSDGEGFVLSSSEFGRAYLADAWATEFIREILKKYLVVFVGYAADDPPVNYLLEALNKGANLTSSVFAFQAGDDSEARAKWDHKGVRAITYVENENHSNLWDTLEAWSKRANDIEGWYRATIDLARNGPETLAAHERGHIAHIVSTPEGARKFHSYGTPPPAKWLCVFDRAIRFAKPASEDQADGSAVLVDGFALYGLDDDPVPPSIGADDHYAKRDEPIEAWDCFALTARDRRDMTADSFPALRGYQSLHVSGMPARLFEIGLWIRSVCDDPACVWWAAGQSGLHPRLQELIRFELQKSDRSISNKVRKSWRLLFDAWEGKQNEIRHPWFAMKAMVTRDGWSAQAIRMLAAVCCPYLEIRRPLGSVHPPLASETEQRALVWLDVKYPDISEPIQVPDQFLLLMAREFRRNLEIAILLESEAGGYGLHDLPAITEDSLLEGKSYKRTFGIGVSLLSFAKLFEALLKVDVLQARNEYQAWWAEDETIFSRLRIWASGLTSLLDGSEAALLISNLPEGVFWGSFHQRDVLLAIAKRWTDYPMELKDQIGRRILTGPPDRDGDNEGSNTARRAMYSLNRIGWLESQGCKFLFDSDSEIKRLRAMAPEWNPAYAAQAAQSLESVGGMVKSDRNYESLLKIPLADVLRKAEEARGTRIHVLTETDPFAGLAVGRPVRALSSLTLAAKTATYPEWAWTTFLNSEQRKKDVARFSRQVALRISVLPIGTLELLRFAISQWLLSVSENLLKAYKSDFYSAWHSLLSALSRAAIRSSSTVIRGNKSPDWATEALNSTVGKLAQALMNDPEKDALKQGQGFPSKWISRVEELINLKGDDRRYALVLFSFNINWFFVIEPEWTKKYLATAILQGGQDGEAVWAGIFWRAEVPSRALYPYLKDPMLDMATTQSQWRRGHTEMLAGFLLMGWGNVDGGGTREVSDDELRDALLNSSEEFRLHMIWQLERWSEPDNNWSKVVAPFFRDVWPRNKKVRLPKTSARLTRLAFSNTSIFVEVADIIEPLITKATGEYMLLPEAVEQHEILEKYPEKALAILFAVLPDELWGWPHDIENIFSVLTSSGPVLAADPRFIELKRRWDSRS